jgi:hypothetical protein
MLYYSFKLITLLPSMTVNLFFLNIELTLILKIVQKIKKTESYSPVF